MKLINQIINAKYGPIGILLFWISLFVIIVLTAQANTDISFADDACTASMPAPNSGSANFHFGVSGAGVDDDWMDEVVPSQYQISGLGWILRCGDLSKGALMVRPRLDGRQDPSNWNWDITTNSIIKTDTSTEFSTAVANNPGRIWFIGNEPDNDDISAGDAMTPAQYARMYRDVATEIKNNDPTATVVFCQATFANSLPPSPPQFPHGGGIYYCNAALDAFAAIGGTANLIDAVSTHQYFREDISETGLPTSASSWRSKMNQFRNWVNSEPMLSGKPLYMTEYGSNDDSWGWCSQILPLRTGELGVPCDSIANRGNGIVDDLPFYGRNNREGIWGVQYETTKYFLDPANSQWKGAWWFTARQGAWSDGECSTQGWVRGDNLNCAQNQFAVTNAAGLSLFRSISCIDSGTLCGRPGDMQTQTSFVVGSTLYQAFWRGDLGYSRTVPIVNGAAQWGSASAWSAPANLSSFPGSGSLQTQSDIVIGSTLLQAYWRNNQGFSRSVPIVNGVVQWGQASGWSGPYSLNSYPGSGDIQAQSDLIIGSSLLQSFWRGNQGFYRSVPIVNGVVQWGQAGVWNGPLSLGSYPGNGDMQAQADVVIGSTLLQSFWRGNEGFVRTVPIVNGVAMWSQASAWSGPQNMNTLP